MDLAFDHQGIYSPTNVHGRPDLNDLDLPRIRVYLYLHNRGCEGIDGVAYPQTGLGVEEPFRRRVEAIGRQVCESVGGKLIGGWYCFGDYDLVIVAEVPDNESMAAIALAVGAGGAIKASKTTVLMTGTEGVEALEKADTVTTVYSPALSGQRQSQGQ